MLGLALRWGSEVAVVVEVDMTIFVKRVVAVVVGNLQGCIHHVTDLVVASTIRNLDLADIVLSGLGLGSVGLIRHM